MSGKVPTKVDRYAAYFCRQMAKSVMSSGLSSRCWMQLSYAIGVAQPLSLFVESCCNERCYLNVDGVANVLKVEFDCRPGAIAQSLARRKPKYQKTATSNSLSGKMPRIFRCTSPKTVAMSQRPLRAAVIWPSEWADAQE